MAVYLGQYQVGMYGLTDLSGASIVNNQNKTVNPSTSQQSVTFDSGYTGLGTVTVTAMPAGTAGTPTASKGTVSDHSISVTPSVTNTTGYITGSTKTGTAVTVTASELVSGTKSISANGTNIDVTNYAKVDVSVPTGSTISNQDKTVNPSTSVQEVTYDSGYTGLGTVTINAMPGMTLPTSAAASATSGYTSKATIGRSTSDQYINIGTGYNAAGAYYKISAVPNGTAGTPSASKSTVSNHSISVTPSVTNTTGYITGSTKTGTAVTVSASELVSGTLSVTSNGTKDVTNYASVSVNVPSSGITPSGNIDITAAGETDVTEYATATVPEGVFVQDAGSVGGTATVSIDSDGLISSIYSSYQTVSPVYQAGWFGTSATVGTTVSVAGNLQLTMISFPTSSGSSATSGYTSKATITPSTSAQYINIPAGYSSGGVYYKINAMASGSATGPSSLSGSSATITTGTNTITLTKTGVTTTPTVSAGYVSSATASTATVTLTASVTVNPTPTVSGATVTIPAGYYSSQITKSVSSGSASAPTSISGTSATVSTGTNTLTLTKTVSVTPVVSAGYVSSGTATNSSVSLTASVTTKAATTYHPSTTAQSISSGTYLTGAQTIAAVTTSNLSASNIVSGVTIKVGDSSDDDCVASVTGNVVLQNYYTGSSAPSSSTGSNGDLYLQS